MRAAYWGSPAPGTCARFSPLRLRVTPKPHWRSTSTHRLRHYLGAYLAQLGGADAIVFTAAVGENSPATRAATLAGLEDLGILIDRGLNQATGNRARVVSRADSRVAVLVVPTDEELEIARQSLEVVGR